MKYMKTWSGVTSGSYLGRDDGYPTTIKRTFASIEEMVNTHGTKENEKYYELSEIDSNYIGEFAERLEGIQLEDLRLERIAELEKIIKESREEINQTLINSGEVSDEKGNRKNEST